VEVAQGADNEWIILVGVKDGLGRIHDGANPMDDGMTIELSVQLTF
jgi:hypothetical protein